MNAAAVTFDDNSTADPRRQPGRPLLRMRAAPLAVLVLAVAFVHGAMLIALSSRMALADRDVPERLAVTYVAELAPSEPVRQAPAMAATPSPTGPKALSTLVAVPAPVAGAASAPGGAERAEPVERAEPMPAERAVPSTGLATAEATPLEAYPPAPGADGPGPTDAAAPGPSAPQTPATPGTAGMPGTNALEPTAAAPATASGEAAGPPAGPGAGGLSPITAAPLAAFEWPPSTRLSYVLTGEFRGEVHGSAQVEWLREGDHYQVHLDVIVGLPVAPFMSRRMSSDGRLGPDGLTPMRYDEFTRIALRPERAASVTLDPAGIRLADGAWRTRPPGVQDAASQFVQMAYLFSLQPDRLAPGRTLELPLALPRRVDTWTYDVLDAEWVDTPFGTLSTVPLRPRPLADRRDTLSAEVWIAPSLRFLPVRLRIRQDEQTYVDLVLSRRPEIAAR